MKQEMYDVMQRLLHNGGEDHHDNIVDDIVSNFDQSEIGFIVELLDNSDVVKVLEGLRNHMKEIKNV